MVRYTESRDEEVHKRMAFSHQILQRRNISTINIAEHGKECTFVTTMNNGKDYAIVGECEDLYKMFESMEKCMMTRNKLFYLKNRHL